MTQEISFTIPGKPIAKGRPRFARRGKFTKTYTPKETANYETLIKYAAMEHVPEQLWTGPVEMHIKVYKPMLKSFSKKKADLALSGELRPLSKPDWDNYGKIFGDALNEVIYKDDSQIVSATVEKYYGDPPRVEVTLITS